MIPRWYIVYWTIGMLHNNPQFWMQENNPCITVHIILLVAESFGYHYKHVPMVHYILWMYDV